MAAPVDFQAFDTEAFGVPCFRIRGFALEELQEPLDTLLAMPAVFVDTKLPASALSEARWLARRGFRKVCTQVTFLRPVSLAPSRPSEAVGAVYCRSLELTVADIDAHSAHFIHDRFSLDATVPHDRVRSLYRQWVKNSVSGRRELLVSGGNFLSFSTAEKEITVDLLSVVEKRRGIGRALLKALDERARVTGAKRIRVVTECENTPAWRLYQSHGFEIHQYQSVFHFTQGLTCTNR